MQSEFKKKEMKILKELRKIINRNVENFKSEPETRKRNQEKLENLFSQTKAELKAS